MSPFLNRWTNKDPWFKATQLRDPSESHDSRLNHNVGGFFMDISSIEKKMLAHSLSVFIGKVLGTSVPESSLNQTSIRDSQEFTNRKEQDEIEDTSETNLDREAGFQAVKAAPVKSADQTLTAVKQSSQPLNDYFNEYSFLNQLRITLKNQKFRRAGLFFVFVFLAFVGLAILDQVIPKFVENYKKSGTIYVEQLQKFTGKK